MNMNGFQIPMDLGTGVPTASFETKRDFEGFSQFRESPDGPWRFYVTGFDGSTDGQDGFCSVLLASGGEEDVPIDAKNCITIHGKKYDHRFWDH